jgi:hypothetical protein
MQRAKGPSPSTRIIRRDRVASLSAPKLEGRWLKLRILIRYSFNTFNENEAQHET